MKEGNKKMPKDKERGSLKVIFKNNITIIDLMIKKWLLNKDL